MQPIQAPAHPPEVAWNGKDLTIDADNSSLMEILQAVRSRTGASIDVPGTAAAERVAVHIGPAPIRDVLGTLLYGTNFDYVLQATDDGAGLRSLVLTVRGGNGKDDDVAVASAGVDKSDQAGRRMMKGWSSSGKTSFQASAEESIAEQASPEKSAPAAAPASDSAAAADNTNTPPAQESAQAPADPSANASGQANATPSADANPSPASDGVSPSIARTAATANTSADSISGDTSSVHSMDDLQRLYEQRRQLQMQQNQAAGKPSN
ncbi:MAG TPA: hypothetical protein VKV39_08155 [Candidatus Sulfotelmatobacter sp.]|nr:hypothetical protein [Candidatus Sulfotelmatobacter sp.]